MDVSPVIDSKSAERPKPNLPTPFECVDQALPMGRGSSISYAPNVLDTFRGAAASVSRDFEIVRLTGLTQLVELSIDADRRPRAGAGYSRSRIGSLDRRRSRRDDDCFAPRTRAARREGRNSSLRGLRAAFRVAGPRFDSARRAVRRLHADEGWRLGSPPTGIVLVVAPDDRGVGAVRPHRLRARTARAAPCVSRIRSAQQGSRLRAGDRAAR